MPTIDVPGRITAIEYQDGGDSQIVELTAAPHGDPRTVIPSGSHVTVVIATTGPNSGAPNYYSPAGFEMDPDFNIGDVVEIYSVDAQTNGGPTVADENGSDITPGISANYQGAIYRKLSDGASPTWGRII